MKGVPDRIVRQSSNGTLRELLATLDAISSSVTGVLRNPGHHTTVASFVVFTLSYYKFLLTSGHFSPLRRVHQGIVGNDVLMHSLLGRVDVGPVMAGNKRLLIDEGRSLRGVFGASLLRHLE